MALPSAERRDLKRERPNMAATIHIQNRLCSWSGDQQPVLGVSNSKVDWVNLISWGADVRPAIGEIKTPSPKAR